MELGINLEYLLKQRGTKSPRDFEEAAALCKNAGFSLVDFSSDFISDDWMEKAAFHRETLDRYGISVEQTHAPMNRYGSYDKVRFWEYYRRCFEISKILGAKYVVVHGDEYTTTDRYDPKEIVEYTYGYLAPFVDYAAKNGLVVAVEDLFEDGCGNRVDGKSRFTSRIDELLAVVERFNTPSVQVCWDFGHANCAYGKEKMLDALKQVGRYLVCTHVHDNYYGKDLHLMPFLGEIDWESHMKYLSECGYKGNFSFEFVYGGIPDSLLPESMKMAHRVGETLLEMGRS